MQFRRPARHAVAINIAPLVDVVFLLVIFFSVTTSFLETSGLELDLPESTSTTRQSPEQIVVHLAMTGALSFQGEEVTADELATRLSDELATRESKLVVLRADSGIRHGTVVRLMDLIRKAGATTLTIAARPEERKP